MFVVLRNVLKKWLLYRTCRYSRQRVWGVRPKGLAPHFSKNYCCMILLSKGLTLGNCMFWTLTVACVFICKAEIILRMVLISKFVERKVRVCVWAMPLQLFICRRFCSTFWFVKNHGLLHTASKHRECPYFYMLL